MQIFRHSPETTLSGDDLIFFRADFIDGNRMQESAGLYVIRQLFD